MACVNRNTTEYKVLLEEFKSPIAVDLLVDNWQKFNKKNTMPTVSELKDYNNQRKKLFSLQKRQFTESIVVKLSDLGIIKKDYNISRNGDFSGSIEDGGMWHEELDEEYVTILEDQLRNEEIEPMDYDIALEQAYVYKYRGASLETLEQNRNRLMSFLDAFNLPSDFINVRVRSLEESMFIENEPLIRYADEIATKENKKIYRKKLPIKLTRPAINIIRELNKKGNKALIVGGAVRDSLRGVENKDIDIEVYGISYGNLENLLSKYGRVSVVGKSFGVIKFEDESGVEYDFSVPRRESTKGVGHKDFKIDVDPNMSPEEAAKRRDFTWNALAYDPIKEEIHDYFGGIKAIQRGTMEITSEQFIEDPLRVLRAMQFQSRSGDKISAKDYGIMKQMVRQGAWDNLPKERISEEFMKWALKGKNPSMIFNFLRKTNLMQELPYIGLLKGVKQDKEWHPEGDVEVHTGYVMDAAVKIADREGLKGDDRAVLIFAALTHDFAKPQTTEKNLIEYQEKETGKTQTRMAITSRGHEKAGGPLAKEFLESIGIKKSIIDRVVPLVVEHLQHVSIAALPEEKGKVTAVKTLARKLEPSNIQELLYLIEADNSGRPPLPKGLGQAGVELKRLAKNVKVTTKPKKDLLQGRDLISLGMKPGEQFSEVLNKARRAEDEGIFNTVEGGKLWVRKNILKEDVELEEVKPMNVKVESKDDSMETDMEPLANDNYEYLPEYEFNTNRNTLEVDDIITEDISKDLTFTRTIINHLERIFPDINVQYITELEYKAMRLVEQDVTRELLEAEGMETIKEDEVKSFFYDGTAYIIKDRITAETAIEEVLHPFVNALESDNKALFNSLLKEAKLNFPTLRAQIEGVYTDEKGFSPLERNLELVTQALTRHFKKEYEDTPTTNWRSKIKDLITWLAETVKNIYTYITSGFLSVSPEQISSANNLTDVAKLLNTEGLLIRFKGGKKDKGAFRSFKQYSLTESRKEQYNKALALAKTDLQKATIEFFFNRQITNPKQFSQLVASHTIEGIAGPLVTLNKKDHIYYEIPNLLEYTSVTTAIKGYMTSKNPHVVKKGETINDIIKEFEVSRKILDRMNPEINLDTIKTGDSVNIPDQDFVLNRKIGDDFDSIVDGLAAFKSFNELPAMKVLNKEVAEEAYKEASLVLTGIRAAGAVLIPQVIVADPINKIAGSIDILAIYPDGTYQVIDLKTSRNSVVGLKSKYKTVAYPVNVGSIFTKGKVERQHKIVDGKKKYTEEYNPTIHWPEFTTEQQHNMQVNLYNRMLHNMGYVQNTAPSITLHIKVEVEGYGKDQKFLDEFNFEESNFHPMSQNQDKVDKVIPVKVNQEMRKVLHEVYKNSPEFNPVRSDNFLTDDQAQPESTTNIDSAKGKEEYKAVMKITKDYVGHLTNREESIKQLTKHIKNIDKYAKMELERIQVHTDMITLAFKKGKVRQVYTRLLKESIDQLTEVKNYFLDPKNFNKNEYLKRINHYETFIDSFEGLTTIDKESLKQLNSEQRALKDELVSLIQDLKGRINTKGQIVEVGILQTAQENWMKAFVKQRSSGKMIQGTEYGFGTAQESQVIRDWSDEDLNELLQWAYEIQGGEANLGDMSTSSDTLMALADQFYSEKVQEVIDIREKFDSMISVLERRLERLGSKNPQTRYEFMLNEDGSIVKELGGEYSKLKRELMDLMMNHDGSKREYIIKGFDGEYTKQEIEHNEKLFKDKKRAGDFWRPEIIVEGVVDHGEYHQYSPEYIKERKKFMRYKYWKKKGWGEWQQKPGVSDKAFREFWSKWHETRTYNKPQIIKGRFTGKMETATKDFIKWTVDGKPTKIPRLITGSGKSMRSKRYDKIMNPKTELGRAEKEFYEFWIKHWEGPKGMLSRMPEGVRKMMTDRSPLVVSRLAKELKGKPSFIRKLWAKTIGGSLKDGVKSLFGDNTFDGKKVLVDEYGYVVDSIPMYFIGKPKLKEDLEKIEKALNKLDSQLEKNIIGKQAYIKKKAELDRVRTRIMNAPSVEEVSRDLGDSLKKFNLMSAHYNIMSESEDVFSTILKVMERREYFPKDKRHRQYKIGKKGEQIEVGTKKGGQSLKEAKNVTRFKKWLHMVFYDKDALDQPRYQKMVNALKNYTSVAYVAFNTFGNINNYMIGRMNNWIETAGAQFYTRKAYAQAELEFNTKVMPDMMEQLGKKNAVGDLIGLSKSDYDPVVPRTKALAAIGYFRMMDDKQEIAETGLSYDQSYLGKIITWAYGINYSFEFNVQSKVGRAIIGSLMLEKSTVNEKGEYIEKPVGEPETLSIFDAMQYNNQTGEVTFKEGFNTFIDQHGRKMPWTGEGGRAHKLVRNYIREVNKQIHGNYAHKDRAAFQQGAIGQLLFQFHKWTYPALKARFRPEYYDENLGYLQGRYRTWISFFGYLSKYVYDSKNKGNQPGFFTDPIKGKVRRANMIKNGTELTFFVTSYILTILLSNLFEDDDDEVGTSSRRLKNALIYQINRLRRETGQFIPVLGWPELFQMVQSPMASTRTLGELGGAIEKSFATGLAFMYYPLFVGGNWQKEMKKNKDFYYQRGARKGSLKLGKEWSDVIPLWYLRNRWIGYDTVRDMHIPGL